VPFALALHLDQPISATLGSDPPAVVISATPLPLTGTDIGVAVTMAASAAITGLVVFTVNNRRRR
jgi:hypothetical protein